MNLFQIGLKDRSFGFSVCILNLKAYQSGNNLFSPNLIKNLEIYSHSNTFLLHKLTPYAKGK